MRAELTDRYGEPPPAVEQLLGVAALRNLARDHGVQEIIPQGKVVRFSPLVLPESKQMRLKRLYPGSVVKDATEQILVPKPDTDDYLGWVTTLLTQLFA